MECREHGAWLRRRAPRQFIPFEGSDQTACKPWQRRMIQHTGMKVSAPLMLMLTAGDVAAIALRATVDESCGGMEGM